MINFSISLFHRLFFFFCCNRVKKKQEEIHYKYKYKITDISVIKNSLKIVI